MASTHAAFAMRWADEKQLIVSIWPSLVANNLPSVFRICDLTDVIDVLAIGVA